MHQLIIKYNKPYDSLGRDVLYNSNELLNKVREINFLTCVRFSSTYVIEVKLAVTYGNTSCSATM